MNTRIWRNWAYNRTFPNMILMRCTRIEIVYVGHKLSAIHSYIPFIQSNWLPQSFIHSFIYFTATTDLRIKTYLIQFIMDIISFWFIYVTLCYSKWIFYYQYRSFAMIRREAFKMIGQLRWFDGIWKRFSWRLLSGTSHCCSYFM